MLIDNGCNVNVLDNYKFTPLHKAVFNEMWEMINLFMANGANASLEYFMETSRQPSLKPICRSISLEYFMKINNQSFLKSICRDASLEYFTKTKRELKVIKKLIRCYNRYKYVEVMKPSDTVNYKFDVLKYLIDSGIIDVNSVDEYKKTPLHYIMETKNNYNIINQLVSKGANINAKDINDETPLHKAVMLSATIRVIKTCLNLGANVNALYSLYRTPLYYAINTRCNINIIKLFLDSGADISIKDKYCTSFLHRASIIESNKGHKIIDMLISRGADINAINIYGVTPLHKVVLMCNMSTLTKILIKHGSNVNAVDAYGRTPLHEVSGTGSRYKMINILVENGADINARDNNGNTPIYNSIYYESSLKVFIDNGASVNIVNNMGVSILQKLSEIYYYDDRYVYTAKILIPKIVLESHIPDRYSNKIGLERNIEKINTNNELKIFFKDKCDLEFNIIKSLKISNHHTLDIFFRCNNVILVNSLINKLDTIKINPLSLPIYYYYIHERIEYIKKRYTLLKSSINKMNSVLKNSYWSLLFTQ